MDRNFRSGGYGQILIYQLGVKGAAPLSLVAAYELLEGGVRALQ